MILIPLVGSLIVVPVVNLIIAVIILLPNILMLKCFFSSTNLDPITISYPFSISFTKLGIYSGKCCPSPSNWIAAS